MKQKIIIEVKRKLKPMTPSEYSRAQSQVISLEAEVCFKGSFPMCLGKEKIPKYIVLIWMVVNNLIVDRKYHHFNHFFFFHLWPQLQPRVCLRPGTWLESQEMWWGGPIKKHLNEGLNTFWRTSQTALTAEVHIETSTPGKFLAWGKTFCKTEESSGKELTPSEEAAYK